MKAILLDAVAQPGEAREWSRRPPEAPLQTHRRSPQSSASANGLLRSAAHCLTRLATPSLPLQRLPPADQMMIVAQSVAKEDPPAKPLRV